MGTTTVHGRGVEAGMEFQGQYVFNVQYTNWDPEDDLACAFLTRIALGVSPDGYWRFERITYGNDDTGGIVKMETVLRPETETMRRVRTLFRAKLDPLVLLPMFLQLIELSENAEYMYYTEGITDDAYGHEDYYDTFDANVDFLLDDTWIQA